MFLIFLDLTIIFAYSILQNHIVLNAQLTLVVSYKILLLHFCFHVNVSQVFINSIATEKIVFTSLSLHNAEKV